jgi:hypothetical protein
MRRIAAATIALVLLITLGTSGVALAQRVIRIEETTQGMIRSVDCSTNTVILEGPSGLVQTVRGTTATLTFVNGTPTELCTLQRYVDGYAIVSIAPEGGQLLARSINVWLAIAPSPSPLPPSYYLYAQYPYYFPYPPGYAYPGGYYGPPLPPRIEILIGPEVY